MRVLPGILMSENNMPDGGTGTHTAYAWWHHDHFLRLAYQDDDLRVLLEEHDRKKHTAFDEVDIRT